jgi:hypothetical protein
MEVLVLLRPLWNLKKVSHLDSYQKIALQIGFYFTEAFSQAR